MTGDGNNNRPLVLVVDDDADLRELLVVLLSAEDLDVATAGNGQEALAAMATRRPDLIVLDMKMPVMDGWELCRRLDATQDDRPPILVMTAAYDPAARAAEVHADGSIGKPFENEEVRALVRRIVKRRSPS
jgi:CheY-like chemotaxis protein